MLIRGAELAGRRVDLRCEGDRIVEIAAALPHRRGEAVVEARGGALLPGLHDHHLHLFALAAARTSVDCGPPRVCDADALARALHASSAIAGWRRGTGYFESVAGPLDRARLDALAPDAPVRIQHRSGIAWFLNSAAIAALDLDVPTHAPRSDEKGAPGREGVGDDSAASLPIVERDGAGRATGRLYRADAWLRARLPPTPPPDLRSTCEALARLGITSFTDATASNDLDQFERFRRARACGEIPQRVAVMGDASLDALARTLGESPGPDGDLRVDRRKFLLDEPALPDLDRLVEQIATAHRAGRGCAFHCVTRSEILFTLAALEAAGRHGLDRIEHASIAPREAIEQIRRLGIAVATQPNFVFERGDDYLADVEPRDRPELYRVASWLEAGVALVAGTDAPYGDADPWCAMRAAVERQTRGGRVIGAAEAIAPERALALFARPPGGEAQGVSIAVGQKADLCLLDRPWAEARDELRAERVAATVCAGRLVFARADLDPR